MNLKFYINSQKILRLTAIFLSLALSFMIIANIVLAISLAEKKESIVIIPPGINEELKITMGESNAGYVKAWGVFLSQLMGNSTPQNLAFIKSTIGPILSPKVYKEFMLALDFQAEKISQDRVSMHFEPGLVQYESDTGLVYVTGRSVVIGPNGDEHVTQRTYEYLIEMDGYHPILSWTDNYRGAAHMRTGANRHNYYYPQKRTD